MRYVFSPRARRDVLQIWNRIARDSEASAGKVEVAIFENCELLCSRPELGHDRPHLTSKDVRVWAALPYENYLIVYKALPEHLYIVRVLHAARRRVWKHGI